MTDHYGAPRPPRLAKLLLSSFLPADHRDSIAGDLEEAFVRRARECGRSRAGRWFWYQAVHLAVGFARERWSTSGSSVEQAHPARSFGNWAHDVRFALRIAAKNPWLTGLSIVALGAGMAVGIASFSLLWDSYFASLPFEDSDRIVTVRDVGRLDPDDIPPRLAILREWNRTQASFDILAASYRRERDVEDGEGGLTRYPVTAMTASGFAVAGVAPYLGRLLTASDEEVGSPAVAVVSHRLWRALLGADPAAIGRTLRIDGVDREIVGLMPEGYRFPVSEDIWIPFNTNPDLYGDVEPRWMRVFGRLAPGTEIAEAQAELDAIRAGYSATVPEDTDLRDRRTTVVPYVQAETEPGTNVLFIGMFVFVVMVLVIACASVANLLLARAASRTGEIAVRAALGASRLRLISQMLVEALLLTSEVLPKNWTGG